MQYILTETEYILQYFYKHYSLELVFEPIEHTKTWQMKTVLNIINKNLFLKFDLIYPKFFTNVSEMIYVSTKNISEIIKERFCDCGKQKRFNSIFKGYQRFCSSSCALKSESVQNKFKNTCLKKYGVQNPSQLEEIKEKKRNTCLKNFGETHHNKTKAGQEQRKRTNIKKYGVEHPFKNEEIKDKIKSTNLEKYDKEYYTQTDEYKKKYHKTCLEKYGVDHTLKSKVIRNKIENTCLEKYNSKSPLGSKDIQAKSYKTCLEKYGVKIASKNPIIMERVFNTQSEKYGCWFLQKDIQNLSDFNEEFIKTNFVKDNYFLLVEFQNYFNCSRNLYYMAQKKFNIIECVKNNRHQTQQEIYEWLLSLNIRVEMNNRKILCGKEIDIYLPDYKLAIEYNGLMFHSFGENNWSALDNITDEEKNKNNHLFKTEECEKQGIRLLHIFENEWQQKKDLWKSHILNKLNMKSIQRSKLYNIKLLISSEAINFFNTYSIEEFEYDNNSIFLGLVDEEHKIIAAISFLELNNDIGAYKLLNYCSIPDLSILGAELYLMNKFICLFDVKKIIKSIDRRFGNDDDYYLNAGFKLINITKPNIFYFNELEKPIPYLINFGINTSLKLDNNIKYRKIYDCGNKIFEYQVTKTRFSNMQEI